MNKSSRITKCLLIGSGWARASSLFIPSLRRYVDCLFPIGNWAQIWTVPWFVLALAPATLSRKGFMLDRGGLRGGLSPTVRTLRTALCSGLGLAPRTIHTLLPLGGRLCNANTARARSCLRCHAPGLVYPSQRA